MLLFVLSCALAQAELTPPPLPPPGDAPLAPLAPGATLVPQPTPYQPRRAAGLLTEPRVDAGLLIGRVGLSIVGGLGTGVLLGGPVLAFATSLTALVRSDVPVLIGAVVTAALVAAGAAVGSAAFGKNFAADFADAFLMAGLSAVVGLGLGLAALFLAASAPVAVIPLVIFAVGIPLIAPPLLVQAFKRDDAPAPTLALARF
jgi:hypothetical protein